MDEPVAEAWHIRPNGPLVGQVNVSGSKNAVTKHMVAAMLGTEPSTITNAPAVGDVGITADILTSLGVGVEIDGDRITIQPVDVPDAKVPLRSPASTASRSCCWARSWPATTRRSSPWSAATASASGRSTSTSRRSRRWAPRSR